MSTKGSDCAFPFHGVPEGLTKREYFAAMAMSGILATDEYAIEDAAERAVRQADALIIELNKTQEKI